LHVRTSNSTWNSGVSSGYVQILFSFCIFHSTELRLIVRKFEEVEGGGTDSK